MKSVRHLWPILCLMAVSGCFQHHDMIGECRIEPGAQCPGLKANSRTLRSVHLNNANLANADFRHAKLYNVVLDGADLGGADFHCTVFSGSSCQNVTLPDGAKGSGDCATLIAPYQSECKKDKKPESKKYVVDPSIKEAADAESCLRLFCGKDAKVETCPSTVFHSELSLNTKKRQLTAQCQDPKVCLVPHQDDASLQLYLNRCIAELKPNMNRVKFWEYNLNLARVVKPPTKVKCAAVLDISPYGVNDEAKESAIERCSIAVQTAGESPNDESSHTETTSCNPDGVPPVLDPVKIKNLEQSFNDDLETLTLLAKEEAIELIVSEVKSDELEKEDLKELESKDLRGFYNKHLTEETRKNKNKLTEAKQKFLDECKALLIKKDP